MTVRAAPPLQPPAEFLDASVPEIPTERVGACIVCGGTTTHVYATGYDFELRTCRNLWTFVQCESCGHVWLNPRPAVSTLGTIYPPSYYAYDYEARVHALARRGKGWLDTRKLGSIIARGARTPRSYLDIGCGSGRYLRAMVERGVARTSVHGLELDAQAVARLVADGFDVRCERAEDAAFAPHSLDLVTMFHVLEHVDAPDRVLSRIAGWMSADGLLAVETPNVDALDRRIFANHFWGGYHIPRHWHLFSAGTLARALKNAGLEPVATLYQTGHSFWMYSLHHWLRYERGWNGLANRFDPFANVVPLAAFTAFDKLRAAFGARTSAMLMLARRRVS